MSATRIPIPDLELANRVGELPEGREAEVYESLSAHLRRCLLARLPDGWSFDGRRVLDFGCGAGRVMRAFVTEAEACKLFEGCDIHAPSIEWVRRHMSPPFGAFTNEPWPPLPRPDAHYDLVLAVSVFTHLTDAWSAWLLELHRVLAPRGLLVASFMGAGMSEEIAGEPLDPARVGMRVLAPNQPWDLGGPMVLHSPWWIEAHWGRAFEIEAIEDSPTGHGWVTMRRRNVSLNAEDLEAPAHDEPRELSAAVAEIERLRTANASLEAELSRCRGHLEGALGSRSWRLTAPARALAGAARRLRRR